MVLIGLLALLPACGGGGGGGDVAPDTPRTNLNYIFGPPRAGVGPLDGNGVPVEVHPVDRQRMVPGCPEPSTRKQLDTTIADNVAVPIVWPDTATPTGDPLFGNLSVTVSQTFRWNGADDPTAGELLITSRNAFFPGTIRMRVLPGGAGIRTEYDSGNDGTYEEGVSDSWGSFYDLWADDSKPLFERVSSFVYYMRQGVFSLIDLSMQTTLVIEDNRTALEAAGSGNAIRVGCDSLQGPPPGYYDIVWTDVNGNGVIDNDLPPGNHDTFTLTLQQCWANDPSDPEDMLLDGVIRLAYYEPHRAMGDRVRQSCHDQDLEQRGGRGVGQDHQWRVFLPHPGIIDRGCERTAPRWAGLRAGPFRPSPPGSHRSGPRSRSRMFADSDVVFLATVPDNEIVRGGRKARAGKVPCRDASSSSTTTPPAGRWRSSTSGRPGMK